MIIRILLYIKHNLKFAWEIIEWSNELLFKLLYYRKFKTAVRDVFAAYEKGSFEFRVLGADDLILLARLINKQNADDLTFFKPHDFDDRSLQRVFKNKAFLMMGTFEGLQIVGYFFLRCFWTRKCFVGRLVDREYQRKGIGKVMNDIMYNIAWRSGFRCLSTISKKNKAVMAAHTGNETMVVLKKLPDDYMLVEFMKKGAEAQGHRGARVQRHRGS